MKAAKWSAALALMAGLAGCGGEFRPPQFSALVSFGDSLSDVGTYAVGTVLAFGGGKYTVNSPTAQNWTEVMADRLNVAAPCAAQTGLDGDAMQGFSVAVTNFPNCTGYAQGGARVTNPVGPGNKLLGGANATLGQLTVPVVTQIQNHLAVKGGSFSGSEVVFVMAGGNDVFIQLGAVGMGGNPTDAVIAMGTAGAELAGYVRTQILAKGARYVVVLNLPDVSISPFALAENTSTQALINTMVTTFNGQLQQGLSGTDVLLVDAYTASRDQSANPASYGISNAVQPACNLDPAVNPLQSSLICSAANLAAGANDNFLFADGVHPTPYGNRLLADLVSAAMRSKGWM